MIDALRQRETGVGDGQPVSSVQLLREHWGAVGHHIEAESYAVPTVQWRPIRAVSSQGHGASLDPVSTPVVPKTLLWIRWHFGIDPSSWA